MNKLSAVIITYNEERNIKRCLDSLTSVADEIVVVDSYSTDKTKEICMQYPVRFIEHEFEGYIEQKNWARLQATYDLVLSLDADEALDETLKQSILKVKENTDADGYTMNRLTNYCGTWVRHSGWYPDKKLRLWFKDKGQWTGLNPHDKFEMVEGAVIKHLKGNILHYSYYTLEDHYKQIEKFTTILADSMYKQNIKSSTLKIMYKSAFKFFRDYIIKLGFLDGKAGWLIAKNSAYATYLKYYKLKKLYEAEEKKSV